MSKLSRKSLILLLAGLLVIAALGVYGVLTLSAGDDPQIPEISPVFTGDSDQLEKTVVAATLDTPIEPGKNVVWSASFVAAWKHLQDDLAKGPVEFQDPVPMAAALNQAPPPMADVPQDSLYAIAGWEDKGIIDQIHRDLSRQFPDKSPPTFPGIVPGSFVAYSYLEAGAKFKIPYFQSREPLIFKDSTGKEIGVSSFGIRAEDDYAYEKLRAQPIAYSNADSDESWFQDGTVRPPEFALDLDSSSRETQVIVAKIAPKQTLAETVAAVNEIISPDNSLGGIGINDVLLVPDIVYSISHHFSELEDHTFTNPALKNQTIHVAQEDILFRLDRNGAELKTESKVYMLPVPTYYVFDGPFLVMLKKREADLPYFAMWVDNAELLTPFTPQETE